MTYHFKDGMKVQEYTELASRTFDPEQSLDALEKRLRGLNRVCNVALLLNAVMGLSGESGENMDLTKKMLFHGHPYDLHAIINELGDVAWYLAAAAAAIGVPLEDILERNIEKLKRRYPEGFNSADSLNRKE